MTPGRDQDADPDGPPFHQRGVPQLTRPLHVIRVAGAPFSLTGGRRTC